MILSTLTITIISVLSNAGFIGGLVAYLRKRHAAIEGGIEAGFVDLAKFISNTHLIASDKTIEHLAIHGRSIEEKIVNESKAAKSIFTEHLTEHGKALGTAIQDVQAHAKQVIDARGQQGNPSVERAVCPSCQRVVWKFQKRADGTILRCEDCAARSK